MQLGVNTHFPLTSWQAHCLTMPLTAHMHMTAPRLGQPRGVVPLQMLTQFEIGVKQYLMFMWDRWRASL